MLGEIMGMIGGSILGGMQAREQGRLQEEAQNRQAELNKEQAKYSQGLAKEYWDYTNWENQVSHLKNAGLNPALMYGGGGTGGQTGGGKAEGVSQPEQKQMQIAQNAQAMGLQLANLESQIKVNESIAEKNKAEAEKTSGVDTEAARAGINKMIAETENEKVKKGLIYADTRLKDAMEELGRAKVDEIGWNIKNIEKSIELMERNIDIADVDVEVKQRTKETEIQRAVETLKNTMADTILKMSGSKVNNAEAEAIGERVKQGWSTVSVAMKGQETNRQRVEQEAEKIYNDLKLGEKGLDIQQQHVIKDYILGIGNLILKGAEQFGGVGKVIKGFR